MRPVHQDVFLPADVVDVDGLPGEQRGNCLQAAIATIFDLGLDDVPHFVAVDDWWGALQRWLAGRNLRAVYREAPMGDPSLWVPWDVPYILTGRSPRGEFSHAVVALNGEIVHDPHPSGAGLAPGTRGLLYLVALDPACQQIAA